jgi:2-polyprenyl-3-methyl-5-hydroxy-6-metoxy-1,4-benzoquinol methylase
MDVSMFTETAESFARETDLAIATGRYRRGELFVSAFERNVPAGAKVLDYGSGPGRISRLLAERGFRVRGVDPAPGMIAVARAQQLSAEAPPAFDLLDDPALLESAGYDAIACSSVIEYVPDAAGLLAHFHRALRPDGTLVISFANRASLFRRYARWREPNARHIAYQHHFWNAREAKHVLEAGAFSVVEGPYYFEASTFDRRGLGFVSASSWIGTLALLVAKRS